MFVEKIDGGRPGGFIRAKRHGGTVRVMIHQRCSDTELTIELSPYQTIVLAWWMIRFAIGAVFSRKERS